MLNKKRFKNISFVYIILHNGSQILMSERKDIGHHNGMIGLPSGHVENNETLSEAIIRECKEEIGIIPLNIDLIHVSHRKSEWGICIDFFFSCNWHHTYEGKIKNMELDKCEKLLWICPQLNLPLNTMPHIKNALINIDNQKIYSEFCWNK